MTSMPRERSLGVWLDRNLYTYQWYIRWTFIFYAMSLFTATHWPNLRVDVPGIERPDLFIHFACFGTWCVLFWASGWLVKSDRWLSLPVAFVVSCIYAGIDEALQAMPIVQRTAAWDDYFANCTGIAIASALLSVIIWRMRRMKKPIG